MRKYILGFFRRGMIACGIGPLVLAIVYMILKQQAVIETLSVAQVCIGIVSLSALAFIAGGMNEIYQIERLPLMVAILIHGIVLYVGYLITYLVNDWLEWGKMSILVFTIIFVLGYFIIWMVICTITQKNTSRLNEKLKEKQEKNY